MPDTHKMLSTAEVATRLGLSISYLNKLRVEGGGPPFVKIGTRVIYDGADLNAWLASRKQRSTSETLSGDAR